MDEQSAKAIGSVSMAFAAVRRDHARARFVKVQLVGSEFGRINEGVDWAVY